MTKPKETLVRCLADIRPERISWLWPGRIARGKLTIIAGDPGLGKSTLLADVTARVTNGDDWPDGRSGCEAGSVLLLSAEDDPADTLRPRLDAADADVSRVFIREAGGTIVTDMDNLDKVLRSRDDFRLVIVDPISAYLGDVDSHNNTAVRAALRPLSDFAAQHRIAFVAVSHLNKSNGGNAAYRVTGSLAFTAAARSVWIVARDKNSDDKRRRLFVPLKNNIGADVGGLAYVMQTWSENTDIAFVDWLDEAVDLNAHDALADDENDDKRGRGRSATKRNEASAWLTAQLVQGPKQVTDLQAQAQADGLSWSTVQKASLNRSDIVKVTETVGAPWKWSLAPETTKDADQPSELVDTGQHGQSRLDSPPENARDDPR